MRRHAVTWARRAAALALGRYEVDEAIGLLHDALELEPDPAAQAGLWQEIGRANALKFDGEGFWAAMQRAIDLGGPAADLYAEMALQTGTRGGMWRRQPDHELVLGWIDRALELADEDSPARAKALAAVSLWNEDEAAARAAFAIAERNGGVELRLLALQALAFAAWGNGSFDEATSWLEDWRACALLPEVTDPNERSMSLMAGGFIDLAAGRIDVATEASRQNDALVAGLTPHHRVHGVGHRLVVAALAGRWEEARGLASRTEEAVDANVDTPCAVNVSSLLNAAIASAYGGDEVEAHRLEAKADAIGMEGYRLWLYPPRIRLAIARADLDEVRRLVDGIVPEDLLPWAYEMPAALLDALVVLGDREAIEAGAPEWLRPRTYVEPFALRALGFARADESMLAAATARFEEMELDWFAEETRKLLASVE